MKKEVIIALDFPTLEKTLEFLDKLGVNHILDLKGRAFK